VPGQLGAKIARCQQFFFEKIAVLALRSSPPICGCGSNARCQH